MNTALTRGFLTAALLLTAGHAIPATALACTENNASTGDPATTSVGNPEWRWQLVSTPTSSVPAPAYVVDPVAYAWYVPQPGEPRWISASGAQSGQASWAEPGGYYTYRTYFYDPAGGTTGFSGVFAVDNALDVFVNGVHWTRYDPPSSDLGAAFRDLQKGFHVSSASGLLIDGGANYIDLRVENYWESPEGILFDGAVRYCT